jgi:peptide/nickel transport system permease protein
MTHESMLLQDDLSKEKQSRNQDTLIRLTKYTLTRVIFLSLTVVVAVYLTVLIANMGGYVDEIRRGVIREQVSMFFFADQSAENLRLTPERRAALIEEQVALAEARLGLDRPFILRSFDFLFDALRLNLGRAQLMFSDSGSKTVRLILLERLPPTLVLWGAGNLILFFLGLFLALFLSRRYGTLFDRLTIALAPTGSAPAWFYGLFLITIFAAIFPILPFGAMVDAPPPDSKIEYGVSVLKHLILPVSAIVLSAVFLNGYNWRTFFLIYSSEDYVEMAKAKGLPDREIEGRYILRPTLPTIVTSFLLLVITLWTGAIVFETIFNWPGLGIVVGRAIGLFETSVIVGVTVIYAYLLSLTVFLLDFIYALVDPRVRVGNTGHKG